MELMVLAQEEEEVLSVPRWEFSDLNLEDRLGQLRGLLRLLL